MGKSIANGVVQPNKHGATWNWLDAVRTVVIDGPASTWLQMAMITTAVGAFWNFGGEVITHSGIRLAFYAGMCLYMIFVTWLYGPEPVTRYGWFKTYAVAALSFALPAVAPNVVTTVFAVVVSLLFARAFIGVEDSMVSCDLLPSTMVD